MSEPPSPAALHQGSTTSPTSDPETGVDDGPVPASWVDRLEWCVVAALVAVMVFTMVRSVQAGWTPISDDALIELRVRDVPGHLPLVGVYSRYGWNHPGPTQFYLLALPYRIGRSGSSALLVGMLALHTTFVVTAWLVARRLDRVAGILVLAALTAVLATTDGPFLRTTWNPYVALVAAGLLVVLAWATAERRAAASAALLGVATLLVQSHLVTAPIVATTVLAGLVLAFVPRRTSDDEAPVPWRWLGLGAAIAAVLWLPPLVDQLTNDPGNLSMLVERRGGDEEPGGLRLALGAMSQAFALRPSVVSPSMLSAALVDATPTFPVWLLVPVASLVLAVRRRDHRYVRGLVVVFASLLGMLAMLTSMTGGVFNYLLVATRPVAAVAVAIGLAGLLASATPRVRLGARCAGCAAVLVLTGALAVEQGHATNPSSPDADTVTELAAAVESGVTADVVSVSSALHFRSAVLAPAVLLQLERHGYQVTSGDGDAGKVGRHRTAGRPDHEVIVAPAAMGRDLAEQGWTVLAVEQADDSVGEPVLVAARPLQP